MGLAARCDEGAEREDRGHPDGDEDALRLVAREVEKHREGEGEKRGGEDEPPRRRALCESAFHVHVFHLYRVRRQGLSRVRPGL